MGSTCLSDVGLRIVYIVNVSLSNERAGIIHGRAVQGIWIEGLELGRRLRLTIEVLPPVGEELLWLVASFGDVLT